MNQRTSGFAITSLVLGILGVLCLPVFGVLGLIFGILGLREISRAEQGMGGRGMAISGIVLGSIGTLLTALLAVGVIMAAIEGAAQQATQLTPRDANLPAPQYADVIGGGFSGSGFHFRWEDRQFFCASLHQFDDAVPSEMIVFPADTDADIFEVTIYDRVHRLEDVQIMTFDEQAMQGIDPLIYDGEADIRYGELVYIMTRDGPLAAHVIDAGMDEPHMRYARLSEEFSLAGTSGSAVVSGVTGHVVGVMLVSATTHDDETLAGFELLELPRSVLSKP
jgi:hypothetical protein